MTQGATLQVTTKRSQRIAAWAVLFPFTVLFFSALTLGIAILIKAAFRNEFSENPSDFIAAFGVLSFLVRFFWGELHNALATYTLDERGVIKRSPFGRQAVRWTEVAAWAVAKNEHTWWLLNTHGRSMLSLDWSLLPPEQVSDAQAFVCARLRQFLPSAKEPQPVWWKRWHAVSKLLTLFVLGSLILWTLARRIGGLIAVLAGLMFAVSLLAGEWQIHRMPSRAQFIVHSDWLIAPEAGITIHLPAVRSATLRSDGLHFIGADGAQCLVPSHLAWLITYIRERVPNHAGG